MSYTLQQFDIKEKVSEVHNSTDIYSRDMSFDYCYNYFKDQQYLKQHDMEKSCLALGFYLGNWGMFRNSFLQNTSLRHYEKVIDYISKAPLDYWKIDLDNYGANLDKLQAIYNAIKIAIKDKQIRDPSQTLITKIMLGVFGSVPALDDNFLTGFNAIFQGKDRLSGYKIDHNLKQLEKFYTANQADIDQLSSSSKTRDVHSGKFTKTNYPKSKIVDLYGYRKGESVYADKKNKIL